MRKVLVLNGPNLDMLGMRDPEIYGSADLAAIEKIASDAAAGAGLDIECFQSNSESELIEKVHEAAREGYALVINAGALTHYSYSLADAIELVRGPVVELHISNTHRREAWRRRSVISPVATAVIQGLGPAGYRIAVMAVAALLDGE